MGLGRGWRARWWLATRPAPVPGDAANSDWGTFQRCRSAGPEPHVARDLPPTYASRDGCAKAQLSPI